MFQKCKVFFLKNFVFKNYIKISVYVLPVEWNFRPDYIFTKKYLSINALLYEIDSHAELRCYNQDPGIYLFYGCFKYSAVYG